MKPLKQIFFGGLVADSASQATSLYPLCAKTTAGEDFDLSAFRGKVVLIVNTASKCGFTKQYDALEALNQRYSKEGLVILGFPSNDFMSQEPGSDTEIESFCRINHGVTFKLFHKAPVTGAEIQPVFKALTTQGPKALRGKVSWNFEKFLLDREGRLIGRWKPWVNPAWGIFHRTLNRVLSAA
jgi:glutathione peroxidase